MEITENMLVLFVSVDKEVTKVNKKTKVEAVKIFKYKLEFIDGFRFMSSSFSDLSDNFHQKECKDFKCSLQCTNFEGKSLI